jgi:hypothetical protein
MTTGGDPSSSGGAAKPRLAPKAGRSTDWMRTWAPWVFLGLGLLIVLEVVIASALNQKFHLGRFDAAGVVFFTSATAVGIERVIETFWTVVSLALGAMWPMNAAAKHLNDLTDSLSTATAAYFAEIGHVIDRVKGVGDDARQAGAQLESRLGNLQASVAQLATSAKDGQQVSSYATAASNAINLAHAETQLLLGRAAGNDPAQRLAVAKALIEARALASGQSSTDAAKTAAAWEASLPSKPDQKASAVEAFLAADPFSRVASAADVAGTVLGDVGAFLATFKDNPGRRLLSIALGLVLGVGIAMAFGLDIFSAILTDPSTDQVAGQGVSTAVSASLLGGVATGVLIGLGSSPTHEVIQALQEYKKRQRSSHAAKGSGRASASAPTSFGT